MTNSLRVPTASVLCIVTSLFLSGCPNSGTTSGASSSSASTSGSTSGSGGGSTSGSGGGSTSTSTGGSGSGGGSTSGSGGGSTSGSGGGSTSGSGGGQQFEAQACEMAGGVCVPAGSCTSVGGTVVGGGPGGCHFDDVPQAECCAPPNSKNNPATCNEQGGICATVTGCLEASGYFTSNKGGCNGGPIAVCCVPHVRCGDQTIDCCQDSAAYNPACDNGMFVCVVGSPMPVGTCR